MEAKDDRLVKPADQTITTLIAFVDVTLLFRIIGNSCSVALYEFTCNGKD